RKPIAALGSSIRSEPKTTEAQAVRYSTQQKARPPLVTGPSPYGSCLLLFGLLALLGDLGRCTGRLSLGLLLRGVALSLGLVPLSLTLLVQVVPPDYCAEDYLGPAFRVFHDALDGFGQAAVDVNHCVPSLTIWMS